MFSQWASTGRNLGYFSSLLHHSHPVIQDPKMCGPLDFSESITNSVGCNFESSQPSSTNFSWELSTPLQAAKLQIIQPFWNSLYFQIWVDLSESFKVNQVLYAYWPKRQLSHLCMYTVYVYGQSYRLLCSNLIYHQIISKPKFPISLIQKSLMGIFYVPGLG